MARKRQFSDREHEYLEWLRQRHDFADQRETIAYTRGGIDAVTALRTPTKPSLTERTTTREADRSEMDRRFERVQQPCSMTHYQRGDCTLPMHHSGPHHFAQFDIEDAIEQSRGELYFRERLGETEP
jgi:hypothetical protein